VLVVGVDVVVAVVGLPPPGAALDRHAAHEAVAHCTAALDALAHVPDTNERARRELALVVARATLLMAIRGYAASETVEAFARARALFDALPAEPALHPVLRGVVSYHQVRAELDQALAVGEQLLRHARDRPDDRVLHVQAHYGQGTTYFHLGRLAPAREHLETALRAYDPAAHHWHALLYGGYDPGVACGTWLAWTLAMQGELDAAADRMREAVALAERHGDAFSLAWAHYGEGVSRQFRHEWAASEAASAKGARLAEEHGFPYVMGIATVNQGWAMLNQGNPEGIAIVRRGVAIVDRTGAALGRANYLGLLGATYVFEGDRNAAIAKLDEAMDELERTGEGIYEPGLLIGRSSLLAEGSRKSVRGMTAVESDLRRAMDVARAQGARLFELRAAVALARHCRERHRAAEGRSLLSAAYAWFEDRPTSAPEIAAAVRLLKELRA
jgi:tetratricopeptide (TPR) repeat protein